MSALSRHDLLERITSAPFRETDYSPAARLFLKLLAIHPEEITGEELIDCLSLDLIGHGFASLCINFKRANEALAPHGLAVVRSGGQPHSTYCLRPSKA